MFVTLVLLVGFGVLFAVKGMSDLKLNEIGDSLAGPAGILAFIWLLTTVMLQNHEMSSLRAASQTQANSLDISAKVQLATHLRALQDDHLDFLVDLNKHCEEELRRFFEDSDADYVDPPGLARNKYEAVPWVVSEIMKPGVKYTGAMSELVASNMKSDFDYSAYLMLDVLHSAMENVAKVLAPLRRYAREAGLVEEQKAWEASLRLEWYQKRCELVSTVLYESRKVVACGGIANEFVTSIVQAYAYDPRQDIHWELL